jgi:hypothetical protein
MHQTITRGPAHEAAPAETVTNQSAPTEVAVAEPATVPAATGAPTSAQPATTEPTTAQPAAPDRGYPESAASMAGVAVLFGVAGLFVFNVIFGPLAIGVGVAAYRRRTASSRTRTAALAGVTLGVLDLVVLAVFAAVSLASGGFTWHFGA